MFYNVFALAKNTQAFYLRPLAAKAVEKTICFHFRRAVDRFTITVYLASYSS